MENLINGSIQEASSAFLIKSERNVQTIIGGEIVSITEGDKLAFITAKVNPHSETVVGIFSINQKAVAVDCSVEQMTELFSELIILTAKSI